MGVECETLDQLSQIVASELKDPIWHSLEWQIGSFSSEATKWPCIVPDNNSIPLVVYLIKHQENSTLNNNFSVWQQWMASDLQAIIMSNVGFGTSPSQHIYYAITCMHAPRPLSPCVKVCITVMRGFNMFKASYVILTMITQSLQIPFYRLVMHMCNGKYFQTH